MHYEVAYARADTQLLVSVESERELTVEEAIYQSGILSHFPEIDLRSNSVGIHGRIVNLNMRLKEGDRVEIYRPLKADPKDMRRRRATAVKDMQPIRKKMT